MSSVDEGEGMADDRGIVRLVAIRERQTSCEDIVSPSFLL